MNILITGACGFVGRHFTEYFLNRGDEVYAVDPLVHLTGGLRPEKWYFNPMTYKNFHWYKTDCRVFFHSPQPQFDLVLHLAAVVGGRLMIENHPLAVGDDLSIDSEFWQWAVEHKPRKVITFSSSAAYPIKFQGKDFTPLTEDMIQFDGDLGMPDMTYGWAKLTSEYLGKIAYQKHGIKSVVYRPFSGYGEDQDLSYPFPSLLMKCVRVKGGVIPVWGSGDQMRDFIHIDDVVQGVVETMDKIDDGSALNLSTGIPTSFKTLIRTAEDVLGKWKNMIISPATDKPEGVFARVGDVKKQRQYGFFPKIDLREGIRRFYERNCEYDN